jgi:REP element-mobilizing transposase RayT
MPRPRRSHDGRLHHVTCRGNNRSSIYEDDPDREIFYGILGRAIRRAPVLCHLDVLMGNHYHLFLEGAMPAISELMWNVNHRYALAYNERHGRINHLFGRRFHCTPIVDERGAQAVSIYIALNPVRAGFCDQPGEWPFGSFPVYAGDASPRTHVTTTFIDELFRPGWTLADACAAALRRRTGGKPMLEELMPPRALLTRLHVTQAVRIFGFSYEEIAAHYEVSLRTLFRWLAG